MYDIRVGIIAEGPTDQVLIRKIISSEFAHLTFVFTNISPTEDEIGSGTKSEGFGWGGVYRVCKDLNDRVQLLSAAGLKFDIIVIHIDGDVMIMTYDSAKIIKKAGDGNLPCFSRDNDITNNCRSLRAVVKSWSNNADVNQVCCIPYINSDVWAAYALFANDRSFVNENMTKEELDQFLLRKGKREGRLIRMHSGKIQKNRKYYREACDAITFDLLAEMKRIFKELNRFCLDLHFLLDPAS